MKNAAMTLLIVVALAFAGCGKDKGESKGRETPPAMAGEGTAAPAKAGEPEPGPGSATATEGRRVEIEVKMAGYVPDRVEAAAGEELVLVFERTEETECGRFVKVGTDPKTTELPMGEPVEIAVTMPESGEVPFTCGMNMMKGVLVVAKK